MDKPLWKMATYKGREQAIDHAERIVREAGGANPMFRSIYDSEDPLRFEAMLCESHESVVGALVEGLRLKIEW
tara:strand:- start:784 stop:1002 length:219 start_codon:yes stop_codon:yes gene_type:complete